MNKQGRKRAWLLAILSFTFIAVTGKVTKIYQTTTPPAGHGVLDALDIWVAPDSSNSLLLLSDRTSDYLEIHDAVTNTFVEQIGGSGTQAGRLSKPTGVAVAYNVPTTFGIKDIVFVVENGTNRVSAFSLPDNTFLGSFGKSELVHPYGIAIYYEGDKIQAWVTNTGTSPNQVIVYDIKSGGDGITGTAVRSIAVQGFVKSIAIDPYYQEFYLCDESSERNIIAYDLQGNFKSRFGQNIFQAAPRGIRIYDMGKGSGWVLVSDKSAGQFEVFERQSFNHLGYFTSDAGGSEAIAIAQRALPNLPGGSFFALNAGHNGQAYDWRDIAAKMNLGSRVVTAPIAAPYALRVVSATASTVSLGWVDSSRTETNYCVERRSIGESYSTLAILPANSETYTDIFAQPGTTYFYRVMAYNQNSDSPYSNEITLTTPQSGSNQPPVAVAEADPLSAMTGVAIQFTGSNSSDPNYNISSYDWNFADGGSSTLADPKHSFSSEGTYDVALTVTDAEGLTDIATVSVHITNNAPPVAIISDPLDGANFNTGSSISFTGTATDAEDGIVPASSFSWLIDMPNGQKNRVIAQGTRTGTGNAPSQGAYVLKLAVKDSEGAPDTAFVNFTVGPRPTSRPVAVAEANITAGEVPLIVQFTGSNSTDNDGTITDYAWNFRDGYTSATANPVHEFQNDGIFDVQLIVTDNNGGNDTAFVSITVNPTSNLRPTALAEADVNFGAPPLTVQFTGSNSTDPDGIIAQYAWDFGDGNTSNVANPQNTFYSEAIYDVQLIVTDDGGLKDTSSVIIQVGKPPVGGSLPGTLAGFNSTNQSKLFYHAGFWWLTAIAKSNGAWYLWKFANDSWSQVLQIDAALDSRPDAYIDSANNKCYILFSHKSSSRLTRLSFANGNWSIDSGFPVTIADFNHQDDDVISMAVDQSGDIWLFRIYNQNLESRRSRDGGQTWSNTIFIKTGLNQPIGLTDATAFSIGAKKYIGVAYGEKAGAQSVYGFLYHEDGAADETWTDETSLLGMWPNVHADNQLSITSAGDKIFIITKTGSPGGNSVKNGLFKRDATGWHRFAVNINTSWSHPAIAFDQTNNDLFLFGIRESLPRIGEFKKIKVGTEEILSDKPVLPIFENGSDNFANISVAQHPVSREIGVFAAAENTDTNQIWAKKISIELAPPNSRPTAAATVTPDSGDAPLTVKFSAASSSDPEDNIVAYQWDFDDGHTGTGSVILHTYNLAKTYRARLIVKDAGALTDTTYVTVIVNSVTSNKPTAIASANITSGNAPLTVNFTGSASNDADGIISTWEWNFDDGIRSTEADPQHTFISDGQYDVRLVVTDNSGLTDTAWVNINVTERPNRPPIANIVLPAVNTVFDKNEAINFTGTGRDPEDGGLPSSNFSWNISRTGSAFSPLATGIKTGTIHPGDSGNYTLMLVVHDSGGLKDSASVQYSVREAGTGVLDWMTGNLSIPEKYSISKAYPNPFALHSPISASVVKIRLGLPEDAPVTAAVFNTLGQTVNIIVQNRKLRAGYHQIQWDGKDSAGSPAPNGIYFLHVRAGDRQKNVKLSLIR